jgi:hypothetical protein
MFESGMEKARAALLKLTAARAELENKAAAAEQELTALRAGAGEAELSSILDGGDSGPKTRARIAELTELLSALTGARSALLARIAMASASLQHARADEIRAEAGKLQKKLDAHLAESTRLRNALEKHEGGARYVPEAEALIAIAAANPSVPAGRGVLKWPAARQMQAELKILLTKAAATESGRVDSRGQATGADLAELLADVANNPMAPPEAEVREAFSDMAAAAIDAWERHITGDFALHTGPRADERLTSYTIAWIDGRVDRQRSAWRNDRRAERFDPNKPKPALSKPAATGDPNEEAAFEEAFKAW